jgi:hypothetical protein
MSSFGSVKILTMEFTFERRRKCCFLITLFVEDFWMYIFFGSSKNKVFESKIMCLGEDYYKKNETLFNVGFIE